MIQLLSFFIVYRAIEFTNVRYIFYSILINNYHFANLKKLKTPLPPWTRLLINYDKKHRRSFFFLFICNSRISSVSFKLWPHGPLGGHFAHFGKPWFKAYCKVYKFSKTRFMYTIHSFSLNYLFFNILFFIEESLI